MDDCVFCAIVAGTAPAWRVYEDAVCLAFLDVAPATRGHTLVVPRAHVADALAMDEHTAAALAVAAHRVAHLLRDRLAPAGMTVLQSNGRAAGQDVLHAHLHVVPRHADDALVPPWAPAPAADADLRATHRLLTGRE